MASRPPRPPDRIRYADPWDGQGWTRIPHSLFDLEISTGAKLTLAALYKYARQDNECFPGQDKLADDVSASVRSIRNYLDELAAHNLIRIERQGIGESNIYWLHRWKLRE